MRCVPLCLSLVDMSITARVKGRRQTFALPLMAGMRGQPFPPLPGLPVPPPPSLNAPAQGPPPPATLQSAVCFNAHGLFINALAPFLRFLFLFSSSSQDHILGNSNSVFPLTLRGICPLVVKTLPRLSLFCFFFFF